MSKNGNIHPTRIFREPKELLKAWNKFKEYLKEQAEEWPKVQYVGKNGEKRIDYPNVPYTFEGFKRFCRNNYGEVEPYFIGKDGYYTDFVGVCRAIKEEIREQQIIGGMLGFYNPSITQRLNGLKDATETTLTAKLQPLFSDDSLNTSD